MTDFVTFLVTTVTDNRATIPLLATKDGITLEYNDSVLMTFSPSIGSIIHVLQNAGEFLRDTAIVNIIDMDCKTLNIICLWFFTVHMYIYSLYYTHILHSTGDQFRKN